MSKARMRNCVPVTGQIKQNIGWWHFLGFLGQYRHL
jgi:hypothetical protein